MGMTKLDETYIFKIIRKSDSFDVYIGIEIPFFEVSVTIEPGLSLLFFFLWHLILTKERVAITNFVGLSVPELLL